MLTTILLLSVLSAIAMLVLMHRFGGLRRWTSPWVDVVATGLFTVLMAGTLTGIATGILAGLLLSVALMAVKARSRLGRRDPFRVVRRGRWCR